MKLEIKEQNRVIELELGVLTQMCGYCINKKDFIIQSLVKHFSSYKYKEYEETLINNVLWNGEVIGRKYFTVLHISNREQLIKTLSVAKMSVVFEYLGIVISDYEYQESIEQLERILGNILEKFNLAMQGDEIGLKLDIEEKSLHDFIQDCVVRGREGRFLEELSNEELLNDFLHAVRAVQQVNPKKYLIIIENIDHMINLQCYEKLCEKMRIMGEEQDIRFILSTSIKRYVVVNRKLLTGIMVVNDEIFTFPDWEYMRDFLERNYPCQFNLSEDECCNNLQDVVQEIGRKDCSINVQATVILKLINHIIGTAITDIKFVNQLEKNYIMNREAEDYEK